MTAIAVPDLRKYRGYYWRPAVDYIAEHVVTEEMVDKAIEFRAATGAVFISRDVVRRNIALGIRANGVWPVKK